jgi:hypothetical protein
MECELAVFNLYFWQLMLIDFVMTLHGQYFFLDYHEHVSMVV